MHSADRLYLFLLVSRSDKRNKEDKEIKCACLCYFSSDRCLYKADRSLKKYDIERQLKFSFRIKMSVPNSPFFVGNVSFILLSYDIRTESDAQPRLVFSPLPDAFCCSDKRTFFQNKTNWIVPTSTQIYILFVKILLSFHFFLHLSDYIWVLSVSAAISKIAIFPFF